MSRSNGHHPANQDLGALDKLCNEPAERGVLGCVIHDSRMVMPQLERAGVMAQWFHNLRHARWFNLFRDMHHADEVVDNVTVAGRLKLAKRPDELGGLEYFTELEASSPSAHNWSYYLPDLRGLFIRRKTIEAALHVVAIARDPLKPFDSALDDLAFTMASMSKNTSSLPDIQDSCRLCESIISDPLELVHGILHKGSKFALGGGSKTCKTWVLLDLAMSIAYGVNWLNFKTSQGPVLFLNMEIHENFFRRRILRVAEAKDIQLQPGLLDVWNLRGFSAPFSELIPKIQKAVKDRGYVLIVLDPIYKIYGDLDENNAGDISRLMNELERLAQSSAAALAFAAHFSKGNQSQKEVIDRISGSGVFARDPDSIITLTAHEEPNAFSVDSSLRNLPPSAPFVVKWQYPLMTPELSLDPTKLKNPKAKSKNTKSERDTLLKLIPDSGHISKSTLLSRAQSKGIGLNRCRGILSELTDEHLLWEWLIQRPKLRPQPAYAKEPQPTPSTPDPTIPPTEVSHPSHS